MSELKIKHRKGELTITEQDSIMYNGACYQLISQKYRVEWNDCSYELSKTICEKLIKQGKLVIVGTDKRSGIKLDYYKLA